MMAKIMVGPLLGEAKGEFAHHQIIRQIVDVKVRYVSEQVRGRRVTAMTGGIAVGHVVIFGRVQVCMA
jgi:hypothetical protein